ncbi:hypothetical protein [Alkalispirochaeta alkalica]|uniref:hypothetical protein n=1 Tax=Alkalispirochaeta alkalica TaxID=46356 RepID=UPI00036929C9|nr:hypothetical protein [Alkalispirochaeta alkalica]
MKTGKRPPWAQLFFTSLILCISLLSCSFWFAPDEAEGRSRAPKQELLVVHSLAETLSSLHLGEDGAFLSQQNDLVRLGAVPNEIISVGYELAITLSGENRLLFLDKERLFRRDSIDFGYNVNPMRTAVLNSGTPDPGQSIFATSGLFTSRIHLYSRAGTDQDIAGAMKTGQSPQAVLVLPDGPNSVRLIVANTAYSSARPSENPFGPASLTVFTLSFQEKDNVQLVETQDIDLEKDTHDPDTDPGLNPVALVDMKLHDETIDEIVVVGSGRNLGSSGTGDDDGTVLVLNRETLEVIQRISVGGSPGAVAVLPLDTGGHVLFLVGTTGIQSITRSQEKEWSQESTSVYTAQGGLPFLSDVVAWHNALYVADFGRNKILRFRHDGGEELTLVEERSVSDGPIALLVRSDTTE